MEKIKFTFQNHKPDSINYHGELLTNSFWHHEHLVRLHPSDPGGLQPDQNKIGKGWYLKTTVYMYIYISRKGNTYIINLSTNLADINQL